MRVLRGTLTFVLGMIIGIILFVVAIGGTIVVITTQMTVGDVQKSITSEEIISPSSQIYNMTLFNAAKAALNDFQNFDTLSLKKLYDHYGIELLNGVSGIDFTTKAFYDVPIPDLVNDLSIVINSFTLGDVSGIAGVDLASYNLPILTDNIDNNISTAVDNILKMIDGDKLSIRAIKDNLGVDLGVGDNDMLEAIQDVCLSEFGNTVNVLRLNVLIDADTDSFISRDNATRYIKADFYQEVSAADLANSGYSAPVGVETYLAGGKDTDADGKADAMDIRELRFVKKTVTVDGTPTEKYFVDNSCYDSSFNASENTKTFYRHVEYYPLSSDASSSGAQYVRVFANHVDSVSGTGYTLVDKGFIPLSELPTVANDNIWAMEGTVDKDSSLVEVESAAANSYARIHEGTSSALLQKLVYKTVSELKNIDGLLDSITVGDIVNTESENTPRIIVALKNSTLNSIGDDINDLTIDQIVDTESDDTSAIMKALAKRHCTINDLASVTDELTLGELIGVKYDEYAENESGLYVRTPIYVQYNEYIHENEQRYALSNGIYSEDENGGFVRIYIYSLYDEKMGSVTRYSLQTEGDSVVIQSLARRGCKIGELGTVFDDLYLTELIRIDESSSHIFKSLAKRGCTLDEFDTIIDEMEIGEVIEINDSSAKIMQSLSRRHCTISNLGSAADELALSEIIDITADNYIQDTNGAFVRIVDENSYILYDSSMGAVTRYSKEGDRYVVSTDGEFAHGSYYTPYNPAEPEHRNAERYTRQKAANSSSSVLQRLSNVSLNNFSEAFDDLLLSDVIEINSDIYTLIDSNDVSEDSITGHEDERVYYYDSKTSLFRVASAPFDPATEYYYVSSTGDSTTILKKMTYVHIDEMETAITDVIDDMILSELIDIYTESAISVSSAANTEYNEQGNYFFEYNANSTSCFEKDGKHYVYVYDNTGEYAMSNYLFVEVPADQLNSSSAYYTYNTFVGLSASEYASRLSACNSTNNLYYRQKDGSYAQNNLLCKYLLNYTENGTDFPYRDEVYYRTTVDSSRAGEDGVFEATVYTFRDDAYLKTVAEANGGLFFKDESLGFTQYNVANPTSLGATPGVFMYSGSTPTYFILRDEIYAYNKVSAFSTTLNINSYNKFAPRLCEDVYVSDDGGEYVYVDGKYVNYGLTSADGPRFTKKHGYIATAAEAYLSDGTTAFVSRSATYIRQKSSPVLRLIADGTISEMTDIITNATLGDIIDSKTGSLLDEQSIKDAKISETADAVEKVFKSMTVGDFAKWSGMNFQNEQTYAALKNVTVENLFNSLSLESGRIDMLILFGYTSPKNTP